MTPAQFKKLQLENDNTLKYVRISNSLLECFVVKKNIIAIKIVLFLAMRSKSFSVSSSELTTISISITELSQVIKTDRKTIIRNFEKMQETSITYVTEVREKILEKFSIVPYLKHERGNDVIEIKIFNRVIELIKDVQNRFTILNAENLVHLKNINTIKMIGLIKMIDGYTNGVAKKKTYTLEDLNGLFGVNYKNYYEFERKILIPVQDELNKESQLTFIYSYNFEQSGRGRPAIRELVIYLKDNQNRQLTLF